MTKDNLPHLWISDEEVESLDKKTRIIPKDRGLDFKVHGAALSSGLKNAFEAYDKQEFNSLRGEDIIIFKMVLPEGEDIYANREIAKKEGLTINVVKDKSHAVVSTSNQTFKRLTKRVEEYKDNGSLNHFQYVEEFGPVTAEEKQASSLKKYLREQKENQNIDVQMMFIPNLETDLQERAADRMIKRIGDMNGRKTIKPYKLPDGTVVIRADVPAKKLKSLTDDPVIYRVEQTGFFQLSPSSASASDITDKKPDPTVKTDNLPVVAVLDSGVYLPEEFSDLVPIHWKAGGVSGQGNPHGTEVASKVIFSHIGLQKDEEYFTPRAKVIDCDIYGNGERIPQDIMGKRIEEAVIEFHDVAKIFNLSSNIKRAIEGDEISILGYLLDSLMKQYPIKFVISAGNHELAKKGYTLEEILDDTDARIAEPADSMLGITVGAIAGTDSPEMFSKTGEPTAYTRIGPGFAGFYKPDLVAYGANLKKDLSVTETDQFSYVLVPGGHIGLDAGTSFTAPVVAGDLAEITAMLPGNSIILAQAMLYNGAIRFWDDKKLTKEEAVTIGCRFGRGLSYPENCLFSTPHRVLFLRSGSLKKNTKERVRFLMPKIQALTKGNNTTRITVTCITDAPIDKTKGEQYLGACITASLHKPEKENGKKYSANPKNSDNRGKWETCNHFTKTLSRFDSGMWEVWLDLLAKWDVDENTEIPYHLVITIEDLTKTNNIYEAIIRESAGRFKPISTLRIPVRS